jgi:hypothetical protein
MVKGERITESLVASYDEICRLEFSLTRLTFWHSCMNHFLLAREAALGHLASDEELGVGRYKARKLRACDPAICCRKV